MRVKKLEIFGFKSFALKQAITFGEGVTGIVGPNGCGKSNVVDAMRWVMGEQNARHLRGGNMQDIIFCGSEKKAPLGFAEVTLTIENAHNDAPLEYNHYQEIEITRRLYKTGESEYEINRQKARLKDICDFFLGTGVGTKAYSIIEQGRVNEIISAKPTDRRLIIEEAAGITKYKAKKAQAERRMENTRSNLSRIVDIKNEVDRRVTALHKEKEKLEKVEALKRRIREIDLHIASHQYLRHAATYSFLRTEHEKITANIDETKREFAVLEHGFSQLLADYAQVHDERRLLEHLETEHKTTLELAKKDLEYARSTLQENVNLVSRITTQCEELEQRKVELETDIENFRREKDQCKEHSENLNAQIATHKNTGQEVMARRQQNLLNERDAQRRIVDAASRAARLQSEITVLRESEAQQKNDAIQMAHDLAHMQSELAQCAAILEAVTSELERGNDRKSDLLDALAQKSEERKASADELSHANAKLAKVEEERLMHASRLTSLTEIAERCEWSESGVSEILASEHKSLVKGIVADVIRVKPGFEDAVERYLAHILDAAIITSNKDLEDMACFIKQKNLPETAFLLLDNNPGRKLTKPIGLKQLSEIVTVGDKFSPVLHHLERFYLAENLTTALTHWPAAEIAQVTIICEQGEMLLPDGRAIILAQDQGKGILKRKNEIIELEQKLQELEDTKIAAASSVQKAQERERALAYTEDAMEQELKTLMLGLVRLEETVKQKRNEHTRIEGDHKKLEEKHRELATKSGLFDEKIANLSQAWSQALDEHKDQEDIIERLQAEKADVDAEHDAFLETMRALEIDKVTVHEKLQRLDHSLSEAQKNLTHVELQKRSFLDQINEKAHDELILKETIRQNEKKQFDLAKEIEATSIMLDDKRKRCAELSHHKEREEKALHALNAREQAHKTRMHEIALELNTTENHIKNTEDRIKEKYRENLREHITDFHHVPLNENNAQHEKNELVKTKDRLGAVNENAGREYDEFKQRSEFLSTQVDDLNNGLEQLEDAIKKINKTTKLRFMEAFQNINNQFSKVFPRLFNGGKAELILTDNEDLLNSGVDIMAKPPGKNIGSIELMSGGEKALTAISLIMAIFLIKPSPFCLLDEVDAPLDEANVARFSQLIKEMSQLSQFIVITHNRKTMESADQLYGVTMEDAGLSKIVSVHVQQAFDSLRQDAPKALGTTTAKKATQLFLDETLS